MIYWRLQVSIEVRLRRRVLGGKRKLKEATKICSFKFQLYARVKGDGLWHLTVKKGDHNHSFTIDRADHTVARRRNKTEAHGGTEDQDGGVPERDFNRFKTRKSRYTNECKDDIQWASRIRNEHLKDNQSM